MFIRDAELKRMIQYAKGLNIEVIVNKKPPKKWDTAASWSELTKDKAVIELYGTSKASKIGVVMNMLHELAHHIGYVYRGRKDHPEVLEALIEFNDDSLNTSKKNREVVYEVEKEDSEYRIQIAKELNLKIPLYKLLADIDLDLFVYGFWIDEGKWPTYKSIKEEKKKLLEKHRKKRGLESIKDV
jgi:hypothetical protein